MENLLYVIIAMLGIAIFGFIVSYIKNDDIRWLTLVLGLIIGFSGFLLSIIFKIFVGN